MGDKMNIEFVEKYQDWENEATTYDFIIDGKKWSVFDSCGLEPVVFLFSREFLLRKPKSTNNRSFT